MSSPFEKLPNAEQLYCNLLNLLRCQQSKQIFFLVGLAGSGAWIAERLAKDLKQEVYGVINFSFHRDDYIDKGIKVLNGAMGMSTKLPFDVNGAYILIVDDVLQSGRTVRAAINELFDYGRPAKVDLAVLVDRHGRELPVDATFKGAEVEFPDSEILILEKYSNGEFKFKIETKNLDKGSTISL